MKDIISYGLATAILSVAAISGVSAAVSTVIPLDVGARSAAMGGAYVALADDASAVVWNPAALATNQGASAAYSFARYGDSDASQHFVAGSVRTGKGGAGLIFADTDLSDIAGVSYHERHWAVGYGHVVSERLAVGVSARRVSVDSYEDARGYESALGLRLTTTDGTVIGFRINGPVNRLRWDDGSVDKWQTTFDVGAAKAIGAIDDHGAITTAVAYQQLGEANWRDGFRLGIEAPVDHTVKLRAGLAYNRLTGGLGVTVGEGRIDAAFAYHPALGKSFVLTGLLSF